MADQEKSDKDERHNFQAAEGPDRNTCKKCGSRKMEVRNHSQMWGDGDVGEYVRMYDSG
jgi:hypothetical protein